MQSAFNSLSQANYQGQIYEALPKTVQKSGKFVKFYVPKSAQPSTVQISYFYPIAGTKQTHGGMMQIVQIAPNQTVKTVYILPPANPKNASIMINAMPKSTWDLQMQTGRAEAIKNPTTAQKASLNKLVKQNIASPVYRLPLKYGKIKQAITLKIPTKKQTTPITNKQLVTLTTTKTIKKTPKAPQKQVQKSNTLWSDIKKDISESEKEVENLVEKI
jgi:hypothetical protein